MTPKQKAAEIVCAMQIKIYYLSDGWNGGEIYTVAKQCALIAVDEIIKILPQSEYLEDKLEVIKNRQLIYWQDVKQEIENL